MSELEGHRLPKALPGIDKRTDMYRLAYDQGLRSLADQASEIDGMRTRAISYMAFVGTATAFLVTSTLRSTSPGTPFYVAAALGTVSFLVAIILLARLIHPGIKFTLKINPRYIVEDWIDRDIPAPSEAAILRGLSGWFACYIEKNETGLDKLRFRFNGLIISASVGLLLWIFAVWAFGRVGIGG